MQLAPLLAIEERTADSTPESKAKLIEEWSA